jgi:hypothetical protein
MLHVLEAADDCTGRTASCPSTSAAPGSHQHGQTTYGHKVHFI